MEIIHRVVMYNVHFYSLYACIAVFVCNLQSLSFNCCVILYMLFHRLFIYLFFRNTAV